jgi:hypothetical protein
MFSMTFDLSAACELVESSWRGATPTPDSRWLLFGAGSVWGIEPTLEIADEVREDLLPETVVEAIQAAERGDEFCLICNQQIASPNEAALLVFEDRVFYKMALSHRVCQTSQRFYTGNVQAASLVPDPFD